MAGNLLHFLPLRSRKLKLLKGIFAFLTSTLFLHFAESLRFWALFHLSADSGKPLRNRSFQVPRDTHNPLKIPCTYDSKSSRSFRLPSRKTLDISGLLGYSDCIAWGDFYAFSTLCVGSVFGGECKWFAIPRGTKVTHRILPEPRSKWLEISWSARVRGFESHRLHHKSTVILIELRWIFLCPKTAWNQDFCRFWA